MTRSVKASMPEERQPCVYMLASAKHGTLYIGVTSNLIQRLHRHRTGALGGFTADHGVHRLVWFERFDECRTPSRARSS